MAFEDGEGTHTVLSTSNTFLSHGSIPSKMSETTIRCQPGRPSSVERFQNFDFDLTMSRMLSITPWSVRATSVLSSL